MSTQATVTQEARLKRVIDGDTLVFDVRFDLFQYDLIASNVDVRLRDVDTHEIHFVDHDSEEYEKGMEEMEFVQNWCSKGESEHDGKFPFLIRVAEARVEGKYGRIIGDVIRKSDGDNISNILKDNYKGIKYD